MERYKPTQPSVESRVKTAREAKRRPTKRTPIVGWAKNGDPIIEAEVYETPRNGFYREGFKQWRFWCEWCRKYHLHGLDNGGGHRVSHCWREESPLHTEGYYLVAPGQREIFGEEVDRWLEPEESAA